MTVRVLTGSKQEIARAVATLEGDVREAIVIIDPPQPVQVSAPGNLFDEMDAFTVSQPPADDSREAIYRPVEGESSFSSTPDGSTL